jgi:hypothetical protein
MGNAEVTKRSNLRSVETGNTDVTSDANIPVEWTLRRKYYQIVPLQVIQLMQTREFLPEITIFPLFNNQICAQTQSQYAKSSTILNTTCYK